MAESDLLHGRSIELRFDEFGWELLAEAANTEGVSEAELVTAACAAYRHREDAAGAFARKPRQSLAHVLRVEVPDPLWERLSAAAEAQAVPVEALVEHAVMLRLAQGT